MLEPSRHAGVNEWTWLTQGLVKERRNKKDKGKCQLLLKIKQMGVTTCLKMELHLSLKFRGITFPSNFDLGGFWDDLYLFAVFCIAPFLVSCILRYTPTFVNSYLHAHEVWIGKCHCLYYVVLTRFTSMCLVYMAYLWKKWQTFGQRQRQRKKERKTERPTDRQA